MELTYANMFFVGLALVMVSEGLIYALFPELIQKLMALAQQSSAEQLRYYGLLAAIFGAIILWIIKYLF